MTVTQVGTPAAAASQLGSDTPSVTGTWSGTQPRTAGDFLVAVVTNWAPTTAGAITGPGGIWSQAVAEVNSSGVNRTAIFTAVAAGGDAAPTFTATNTGTATNSRMTVELYELTGQDGTTPVITTGVATGSAVNALTVTSGANVPSAGCYGIAGYCIVTSGAAATGTYTPGTGWTNTANDASTSLRVHAAYDVIASPSSGATVSDAATWSIGTNGNVTAAMIVVQPSAGVTVPSLLIVSQSVQRSSAW